VVPRYFGRRWQRRLPRATAGSTILRSFSFAKKQIIDLVKDRSFVVGTICPVGGTHRKIRRVLFGVNFKAIRLATCGGS